MNMQAPPPSPIDPLRPGAREHLVVVGNGMAACRAIEELIKRDPARFKITVIGAEPRVNYNRIMLSPVLAGEKSFEEIVLNDRAWYQSNDIALHIGDPVAHIDRVAKKVRCVSGQEFSYDRLMLATGSNPVIIGVPGKHLPGVVTFRDIDDVNTMVSTAGEGKRAVVIGGGLLGLEAAYGLSRRGMGVTVVHLMASVMERQLDEAAGYLLKRELERRGMSVLLNATTEEIIGSDRVEGIRLKDGQVVPADLVVMAVGIRPNTDLAKAANLAVGRGIQVDDHMVTSDAAVMAVGECVEHRGQCYGLVAPLWEMCAAAADHLAGIPKQGYEGSVLSTKLKVSGIDVFSAGVFSGGEGTEDIVLRDAARSVYKRVVLRDEQVVGAVLYGDTDDGAWYFQLMKSKESIAGIRDLLIFGQSYAVKGHAADPFAAVAALPDDAEICGCNGICKGAIVEKITKLGLTTLDDVRTHTKASSSCGSCTGQVEKLIALTVGEEYVGQRIQKPLCKCTDFTHADVRKLILEKALKAIPAVMQELHWKTPDGCSSCRPALNYYLLCAWPGEYQDDQQSRFINERAHANIQKDGTYSVVPRMWGGVTSAAELRAIADVADKFAIPTVKITGGQRIDLLGVKKEQLPAVWADLNAAGMVSGHAYGKALRTVKTCVGSEWCRFGTQDSTGLGIKLEKATWGSWMPHKFKMAVSGCPRNCAEATIKDFGVICVDSGYELHVGGNGGIKLRSTELLCKVDTEAEVLEYSTAFIQLYREDARYLERTAPWIERVGLDYLKQRLVNDADGRVALACRFSQSQKFFQKDPWAERAHGKHAREFSHMLRISNIAAEQETVG